MKLNALSPAKGSRTTRTRVGRGIGCGKGKTAGKGHKGQKARAGGYHKINFEGGQMPIQRRLPKMGFKSRIGRFVEEVNLSTLEQMKAKDIDLTVLKEAGIVPLLTRKVKIIASGEIKRAVTLKAVGVTKGARAAIESAGGKIA